MVGQDEVRAAPPQKSHLATFLLTIPQPAAADASGGSLPAAGRLSPPEKGLMQN